MIDIIFAIKFVHLLAVAAMFGTWLGIALFVLFAHRSRNTSVVALTSQFVVRVETIVMAAAIILQPISGIPLAYAIGLTPMNELWIVLSLAIYGVVVLCWIFAFRIEYLMRNLTREAALKSEPLPGGYRLLFRVWAALAVPILGGMIAMFALMIWQPRWS